jgi:hypothetical protein
VKKLPWWLDLFDYAAGALAMGIAFQSESVAVGAGVFTFQLATYSAMKIYLDRRNKKKESRP